MFTTGKRISGLLTVATATLALCAAQPAQAAPPGPTVEAYTLSTAAPKTQIRFRDGTRTMPMTGHVTLRVDGGDPTRGLRLTTRDFSMTGQAPTRAGETITIEQNDVDVDAKSLLKMTQSFPPKFEQLMVLSFTMTIDQPEREPLILTTKDPAKLIGSLTQFPPKGDLYQLQNPVDLVFPDDPNTTIATIQKFPVKVGGL